MTIHPPEQMYFKLCSDHLSVEAIPKRRIRINFSKMKGGPPKGYELVVWTPHFLVLRSQGGQEITLREDGRMIVRKSRSESIAREAAVEIMRLVLKDFRE
jgi:hypothetical protein